MDQPGTDFEQRPHTPETNEGERTFTVASGQPAVVKVTMPDGAVRLLGSPEATAITVRAVKTNGEVVPIDFVAEIQARQNGEVTIKGRHNSEIQRQIRKARKVVEQHDDWFDELDLQMSNLGEMLESLTDLKSLGKNLSNLRLEVTVPRQATAMIKTLHGTIQAGRIEGSVMAQSVSGNIDCASIDGNLTVKSSSGSLRLGDITGSLSAQSNSGRITTRNINGDLVAQTMSGSIQGHALSGQIGLKSQSGSLLVQESDLTGLYLNTISGRCSVQGTFAPGEYEIRTVSGSIVLYPQPDLAARLSGRTVSGSFVCSLPYVHADDDWRNAFDDEPDGDGDGPEIDIHGLHISGDTVAFGDLFRVDETGFQLRGLRINEDGIELPGMSIRTGRGEGHRERRRRGRNRWEYLLGDPATANAATTRLRVRTVSGSLAIRTGDTNTTPPTREARRDTVRQGVQEGFARPARPTDDRPEWPDTALWPAAPEAPAAPPMPNAPEAPVAPPAPTAAATTVGLSATPEGRNGDHPAPAEHARNDDRPATEHQTTTAAPQTTLESPATAANDEPTDDSMATTATAAPASKEQTRLEVLQSLQRGEITTEEALLLLSQLDA